MEIQKYKIRKTALRSRRTLPEPKSRFVYQEPNWIPDFQIGLRRRWVLRACALCKINIVIYRVKPISWEVYYGILFALPIRRMGIISSFGIISYGATVEIARLFWIAFLRKIIFPSCFSNDFFCFIFSVVCISPLDMIWPYSFMKTPLLNKCLTFYFIWYRTI